MDSIPLALRSKSAADIFAVIVAVHWTVFGTLLTLNPSGGDKGGLLFHPGSFLPLWDTWDPMAVMVGRSCGASMVAWSGPSALGITSCPDLFS